MYSSKCSDYCQYARAINSDFAEKAGYDFLWISQPFNGIPDDDPRWTKVNLMRHVIDPNFGCARNASWVVWVDADMIILDFNFRIERLVYDYPTSHILMSKDIESAPFVSNSGFIMVRNSLWSLDFLDAWWNTYDRRTCCDQNALTWLYDRKLPVGIDTFFAVLPVDAVNTDFPCWKNQKPHNSVLHLAGLSSLYRRNVFELGYRNLRFAENNGQPIPPQLGLTREVLLVELFKLNDHRAAALLAIDEELDGLGSRDAARVGELRVAVEDIMKVDDDEHHQYSSVVHQQYTQLRSWIPLDALSVKELAVRRKLFWALHDSVHVHLHMELTGEQLLLPAEERLTDDFNRIQDVVSAGFEFLVRAHMKSTAAARNVTAELEVLGKLGVLVAGAGERFREYDNLFKIVLYYQFKHAQLMADMHPARSVSSTSERIYWLRKAAAIWTQLDRLQYYGTNYVLADPQKEYADVLCELGLALCLHREYDEGLGILESAAEKLLSTIDGYKKIRIATASVAEKSMEKLADTYINAGLCCSEGRSDLFCRSWFVKATSLLRLLNITDTRTQLCENKISKRKKIRLKLKK